MPQSFLPLFSLCSPPFPFFLILRPAKIPQTKFALTSDIPPFVVLLFQRNEINYCFTTGMVAGGGGTVPANPIQGLTVSEDRHSQVLLHSCKMMLLILNRPNISVAFFFTSFTNISGEPVLLAKITVCGTHIIRNYPRNTLLACVYSCCNELTRVRKRDMLLIKSVPKWLYWHLIIIRKQNPCFNYCSHGNLFFAH